MGVYIPGMEMPKSCYKCPLRRRDGMDIVCPVAHERFSVADVNILDYRLVNCPLVPVPEHGRLIDADALEASCFMGSSSFYTQSDIDYAPTIIPAEPPKEET